MENGHWLIYTFSQFWGYNPPKLAFPQPKSEKSCFWVGNAVSVLDCWNFRVKILNCIIFFPAKILSRRSRLSRWSRAPSRLIRPRPIDCDRGPKQRVKIFPVFGFELCHKKSFFQKVHDLVVIYTPKEAHSGIFVTRGSVIAFRVTNAGQRKILFSGRPTCTYILYH